MPGALPTLRKGGTWQDFLAAAQQTTTVQGEGEQRTGHWGFVSHAIVGDVFLFVLQHGGKMLDDLVRPTRPVFNDPLAAEAIQWYADLGLLQGVMPIVETDKVDASSRFPVDTFSQQQAAMVIGGIDDRGGDIIPWDFAWGAVPIPRDQHKATYLLERGYYIAAQTDHPQQAWELLRSLSESEQVVTSLMPARQSVAESDAFRQQIGAGVTDATLSTLSDDTLLWVFDDRQFDWIRSYVPRVYWVVNGSDTAEEMMAELHEEFASWSFDAQ